MVMRFFEIKLEDPTDGQEFTDALQAAMQEYGICDDDIVRTTPLAGGTVVVWWRPSRLPETVQVTKVVAGKEKVVVTMEVVRNHELSTQGEALACSTLLIDALKTVL
jgi:hypothetical protein